MSITVKRKTNNKKTGSLTNREIAGHISKTELPFRLDNFRRGGRCKLAEIKRLKVKENLKTVKGSLAIEGLQLTKEEENLILANALGVLSDEEFDRKVMELLEGE
ncbi:hypothetical protein [Neobacillus sp. YIM B06451]|uniref:hypothetical protein n=1 Tax=Neobacillus sp. YIM B06451 TaxID=3070994 RepID=UPI00292DD0AF|nr:hypothetical protein [Neobacillus sp. YIM B06451]